MNSYWVKTPKWLPLLFPRELKWRIQDEGEPTVYLTFDDGPHPEATVFALEQLREYRASATFFCIGKNVQQYPELYRRLQDEGHIVANHTQDHLNSWKTENSVYLNNILKASRHIGSRKFRPPYGRIKISVVKRLIRSHPSWEIYMWDVLSGDFDTEITPEQCLQNVLDHVEPGSIVVFHDSAKAFSRMSYALPRVLAYCREKNWQLKGLP